VASLHAGNRVVLGKSTKASGSNAGLPDGLFSNQKSKFGQILEGLGMEDVALF
jgi:hypothetical protein